MGKKRGFWGNDTQHSPICLVTAVVENGRREVVVAVVVNPTFSYFLFFMLAVAPLLWRASVARTPPRCHLGVAAGGNTDFCFGTVFATLDQVFGQMPLVKRGERPLLNM